MTERQINPGVKISGAPNWEEVSNSPGFPKEDYWRKGPVIFIECVEEIPCNPCESSCPRGAITVGKPITNLPAFDAGKCIGCSLCIAACPGLAIYLKDYNYSEQDATITFPFEYYPLPEKGEKVTLIDEMGNEICLGVVLKIATAKQFNHTTLITAAFPKDFFLRVKSMKKK